MNILSCFNGMNGARLALEKAGVRVDSYFSSEVDPYAIKVTQRNHPDTIQVGDITKLGIEGSEGMASGEQDMFLSKDIPIDLLIGGSPCQGFSFAGKQLNFDDPRSKLFFEFVRLKNELKPKFFLLENVRMKKEYQDVISEALGVEPININSNLVSAQNRNRYYWTNIPFLGMPEDKGIFLKDIIEDGEVDRDKSHCIDANYFKGGNLKQYFEKHRRQLVFSKNGLCHIGNADIKGNDSIKRVYSIEGKCPTLSTCQGGHREPKILCGAQRGRYLVDGIRQDGKMLTAGKTKQYMEVRGDGKTNTLTTVAKDNNVVYDADEPRRYEIDELTWRKLTPIECERLQTVPDGYTEGVSNTQRYKMLGNGFTVDVIAHLLSGLLVR